VAITAELIALRRHSEAPLPHLRYVRKPAAESDSPAESPADLHKN